MANEAETALVENVGNPQKAAVDGVVVEQYDLEALIAADKYLNSKAASKSGLGVKFTRVIPPGAI